MATLTANNFYTTHTKLPNKPPSISTTTITFLSLSSSKPTFSLHPLTTTTTTTKCSGTHQQRPEYTPERIPDNPNYVRILDTTLRDGEQSPGAAMTANEKLEIARHLARLGVDVVEAGFPAASKADLEAVKAIAVEVGNNHVDEEEGWMDVPVICGLCRCNKEDIEAAWEAVRHAEKPRIHTFIATSEIHMQYKLNKAKKDVVEIAKSMVSYARSLGCHDVEFSPEDAGRYPISCSLYFDTNYQIYFNPLL